MKFDTIREATEHWVGGFNAIPQSVIEKLMKLDVGEVTEVTPPGVGDIVYLYDGEHDGKQGEIVSSQYDGEDDLYEISIDGADDKVVLSTDEFDVDRDSYLPIWGTMWSFGDKIDDWWLEERGGLQSMADCGIRVYEQEDFGYIFGIDGAGYSFYEEHWIPLYKARGLHWHKEGEAV